MRAARRPGCSMRPSSRADATALPFADGAVSLAWSLGVLCTAPSRDAQLAMLLEMRRVVRPGGRIGLLVYLAVTAKLDDPPPGNHFPTSTDLHCCSAARAWRCWP
jgi:Methylase involved in ubiquinone/menaquinone biosynthesis